MKLTTLTLSKDTRNQLAFLKLEINEKSYDSLLQRLIKFYKEKNGNGK